MDKKALTFALRLLPVWRLSASVVRKSSLDLRHFLDHLRKLVSKFFIIKGAALASSLISIWPNICAFFIILLFEADFQTVKFNASATELSWFWLGHFGWGQFECSYSGPWRPEISSLNGLGAGLDELQVQFFCNALFPSRNIGSVFFLSDSRFLHKLFRGYRQLHNHLGHISS